MEFIIEIYMEILAKGDLSDNMVKLICWVIGEIGCQESSLVAHAHNHSYAWRLSGAAIEYAH